MKEEKTKALPTFGRASQGLAVGFALQSWKHLWSRSGPGNPRERQTFQSGYFIQNFGPFLNPEYLRLVKRMLQNRFRFSKKLYNRSFAIFV